MPQQISKKILVYLFFFIIFGSLNNKNLSNIKLPMITLIKVTGIEEDNNFSKNKILEFFELKNLFFLNKSEIKKLIDSNNIVEKYSVFKKYLSTIEIEAEEEIKNIAQIFGDFNSQEFFRLKTIIDYSNFDYNDIENLIFFPSGRWDIQTKSGILIRLPKEKIKESLNFSLSILLDDKTKNAKLIDLRQRNQVILNE